MEKTIKEIIGITGGELQGDPKTVIKGACGIKEAKEGDITFLANSKYKTLMNTTAASAVIVPLDISVSADKVVIRHESPSLAFSKLMKLLGPEKAAYTPGIDKTAVIGKNVRMGGAVTIQAYVVIEDEAVIGDKTVIGAGSFVGNKTKIGRDTLIYPHVVIREGIVIGERCIIHSGTVIGSDGFGYATVRGMHHKIPQIGTVVIEDDVEIGANVTIDRARFDKTWIKRGTKIDNLVQIAHNVIINENTIVVSQTGISGSTEIGKNVILAGQSGVAGHLKIGDNAIVGGQAGVTKSVPANTMVSGYPAAPHDKAKKLQALINRLPKLYEKIAVLEKEIAAKTQKCG